MKPCNAVAPVKWNILTLILFYLCGPLYLTDCRSTANRLYTVNDIHSFQKVYGWPFLSAKDPMCRLIRVEPQGAVHDEGWADTLALKASRDAKAEILCGTETEPRTIEFVTPGLITLYISEGKHLRLHPGTVFGMHIKVYDLSGRPLEVGQFVEVEWKHSEVVQEKRDPSAAEFGFCNSCYGQRQFRAVKPGMGTISARLEGTDLTATMEIEVKP